MFFPWTCAMTPGQWPPYMASYNRDSCLIQTWSANSELQGFRLLCVRVTFWIKERHLLGSVIEGWQSVSPYYSINFSLGTLLYIRVKQQVEETESQGLCSGLRTSHEHVHAYCQQLRLWKQGIIYTCQRQNALLILWDQAGTTNENAFLKLPGRVSGQSISQNRLYFCLSSLYKTLP